MRVYMYTTAYFQRSEVGSLSTVWVLGLKFKKSVLATITFTH